MTRFFSRKLKLYLCILAGGRCEACGVQLPENFHGDHKQPFSKGGSTVLANGQALCPKCNLAKGARHVKEPSTA